MLRIMFGWVDVYLGACVHAWVRACLLAYTSNQNTAIIININTSLFECYCCHHYCCCRRRHRGSAPLVYHVHKSGHKTSIIIVIIVIIIIIIILRNYYHRL